jgi:hypothetical protein
VIVVTLRRNFVLKPYFAHSIVKALGRREIIGSCFEAGKDASIFFLLSRSLKDLNVSGEEEDEEQR